MAVPALAETQESAILSDVEVIGGLGDPLNEERTINLTGGYAAGAVHAIFTWDNTSGLSHPFYAEAVFRRAAPFAEITFDLNRDFGLDPVPPGETLYGATINFDGIDPAGEWTIEFYAWNDLTPGVDLTLPTLEFLFEDQSVVSNGADMTLCQVYGLTMNSGTGLAREGDMVGLTLGTTSWNIGERNLIWIAQPDPRHPMIAMNIYRLSQGRFQQIGLSWVKHGFFALSNTQCGGFCNGTNGQFLGVGCTDTYSPGTNANQNGLGPRFEIDPWTGVYDHPTSILENGIPGGDTNVTRRIQVHDDDLDPTLNPGASYFMEGFYITGDDGDVMNNAAHKPFTVAGQTPAQQWIFGQSSQTTAPEPGFAVKAWAESTGARQTMLAQELPVNELTSPDGRCLLISSVTDNMDGTWRYEYALLNIDMARQVGSFEIEASPGVTISGIGSYAPMHHDEPTNVPVADGGVPIDNAPWSGTREASTVRWETTTNPLRWGTLMNFWFDADTGPADGAVDLGLFTSGMVTGVSGTTDAPAIFFCLGDADGSGTVDFADVTTILTQWGNSGPQGDSNNDGSVNFADITETLANWLATCP